MNKFFLAVCILCSFLFSGCAAVVQGGAALAAGSAKDHPAKEIFIVGSGKNDVFNIAMRSLTANGRKVTTSDREAGIVQGEVGDYAVTIKIGGKSSGSAVDISVAYNQSFIYGSSQVEKIASDLKNEIEAAAGCVTVAAVQIPEKNLHTENESAVKSARKLKTNNKAKPVR